MKIGLGESTRFLRHHHGWLSRLVSRQFRPDRLVEELARSSPSRAGTWLACTLSFSEVEATERWRRRTLAQLAER